MIHRRDQTPSHRHTVARQPVSPLISVCFRLFQLTHVGQVLLSLLTREWSDRSQGRWRPLPPVLTLSTESWPCATPPTILSTPTLTSSPAWALPPESPQPPHPPLLLRRWTEPALARPAPHQVSVPALPSVISLHFTFYILHMLCYHASQPLHFYIDFVKVEARYILVCNDHDILLTFPPSQWKVWQYRISFFFANSMIFYISISFQKKPMDN